MNATKSDSNPSASNGSPSAGAHPEPYWRSPVFDEHTVPSSLLRDHTTKDGVWGVVRVLEGKLRLHVVEPPSVIALGVERAGLVQPQQKHFVEFDGSGRFQVEFYENEPDEAVLTRTQK